MELNEADGIARKILSRESVSEEEFRYAVMFNLTAMTQLLWELSNGQHASESGPGAGGTGSNLQSRPRGLRVKFMSLAPLAALAAFLAGVGLGYLLP